jgi:hypothetical protein
MITIRIIELDINFFLILFIANNFMFIFSHLYNVYTKNILRFYHPVFFRFLSLQGCTQLPAVVGILRLKTLNPGGTVAGQWDSRRAAARLYRISTPWIADVTSAAGPSDLSRRVRRHPLGLWAGRVGTRLRHRSQPPQLTGPGAIRPGPIGRVAGWSNGGPPPRHRAGGLCAAVSYLGFSWAAVFSSARAALAAHSARRDVRSLAKLAPPKWRLGLLLLLSRTCSSDRQPGPTASAHQCTVFSSVRFVLAAPRARCDDLSLVQLACSSKTATLAPVAPEPVPLFKPSAGPDWPRLAQYCVLLGVQRAHCQKARCGVACQAKLAVSIRAGGELQPGAGAMEAA